MKNKPYKYLIKTKPDFQRLLEYLDSSSLFSLDTETNGNMNILETVLVGISFGFDLFACYIPLMHLKGHQLQLDYVLESLKPALLDKSKEKIYHNAVFDENVLMRYGIDIQGTPHDTVVMAHMYDEHAPSKKLKFLTNYYLKYKMQTYEEIIDNAPLKRGQKRDYNFARVSVDDALSYAADDAYWTYRLYQFFKRGLQKEGTWNAYTHIEGPLQRVVRKMKARGVTIDLEAVRRADELFPRLMEEIETEIYREAGEVFNVNSGKQLGPILFEKLDIGDNVKKTMSGQYSTDEKTLKLYSRYPIVENVLKRKKITKAHGTFVKGLEKYILRDGRVHCDFNSTGTDTGRFSSSKPNLQNQPGADDDDAIEDIKIRDFFIPTPGYKMVVADYSQIELRLIAHFSRDEDMTSAFVDAVRDFHDETARKMLKIQGTPITYDEMVTPRQRFHAKSLNFGIPYGRGDYSIAEMLGCYRRCAHWPTWNRSDRRWEYLDPETEEVVDQQDPCHECGKCFIRDWYAAFPRVEPFKEHVFEQTRHLGYVRTLSGRKRRLPLINSRDYGERTHAERQSFSTKIQGSAGDILKLAMVALEPKLAELDAYILMTVHDELVMEAPEDRAEEVVAIAKQTMENPLNGKNPIRLPLVVEPQTCDRWSEGK